MGAFSGRGLAQCATAGTEEERFRKDERSWDESHPIDNRTMRLRATYIPRDDSGFFMLDQ